MALEMSDESGEEEKPKEGDGTAPTDEKLDVETSPTETTTTPTEPAATEITLEESIKGGKRGANGRPRRFCSHWRRRTFQA